ncbi:recombination-associated protein RdgC [Marinobacterium stanieri]|uniref:Recombination-associated protein RdgC n=1 Tax=Marinobacterium stanieri TaxID=49186 RepID=A0A1N6QD12_9GAMM|nr:recombination-associated protein RdgC [Marinobacterium stanieri]SIQ14490.1 recombination associated protein RdgC [Marinobacterium stanieri]
MFNPKNAIAYLVNDLPDAETLQSALAEHPFRPRGSQELSSMGWATPCKDATDGLVFDAHGWLLIGLKYEEADLKAAVVREQLANRVDDIEQEESRKVYRKEKLQLKDEVVLDLLPRAFNTHRMTYALLNPEKPYLFIEATSHKRAEELLNALREALGSLKVALPLTSLSADKVMTGWLTGEQMPNEWALGDECELRDPMAEGGKIAARGQELMSKEITAHIEGGYLVKRLALEYGQVIEFVLHEDLSIHRIRLTEEFRDQIDADTPDDVIAALDAAVWRWGTDLTRLMNSLVDAMGGIPDQDSFQLVQEQDDIPAGPLTLSASVGKASEKAVMITSKLYQMRQQQIFLGGEERFKQSVEHYRPMFEQVMADQKCDPIKALITLLDNAKGHQNEGMLMHVLSAVACELAEPSLGEAA